MNAPQVKTTSELRNVTQQQPMQRLDMFTPEGIGHAMKLARLYQTSSAVPAAFRDFVEKKDKHGTQLIENPNAVGNCIVAIETAMSVGMSITAVMQNANVIEGRLSWSGQFVIAALNSSGRFTPLRFETQNKGKIKAKYKEKGAWNNEAKRYDMTELEIELDNWECVAWAYYIENGVRTNEKVQSIPVSMKMAVEEGWYAKAGSKWQTELKFQMLQYRAATFLGRIAAPDIIMGMGKTTEEALDIIDVTPQENGVHAANVSDLRKQAATMATNPPQAKPDFQEAQNVKTQDFARPETPENELKNPNEFEAAPASESLASLLDVADAVDTVDENYTYALSLVERGDCDEALDLVRGMSEENANAIREKVRQALAKQETSLPEAKAAPLQEVKATPPRTRSRSNIDMGG